MRARALRQRGRGRQHTDVEPVEKAEAVYWGDSTPVTLLLACTKIYSATSKSNDRDARIREMI
jgi:hypothetical protein